MKKAGALSGAVDIAVSSNRCGKWATQRWDPASAISGSAPIHAALTKRRRRLSFSQLEMHAGSSPRDPKAICPCSVSGERISGRDDGGLLQAYHSLGIVEDAQNDGAPAFDIVLCDEAHRTTGVERFPATRTLSQFSAGSRRQKNSGCEPAVYIDRHPASRITERREDGEAAGEEPRLSKCSPARDDP